LVEAVDLPLLQLRVGNHLKDVRQRISPLQATAWNYFLPRKLGDFFYAANGEGAGKPIDRIFLDLDRGPGVSSQQAQEAANAIAEAAADDPDFQEFSKKFLKRAAPLVAWTGSSFHLHFFLRQAQPQSFYSQYFQSGFPAKWAAAASKCSSVKISCGHEKKAGAINLDASQTPSGKLCRVPLGSLHMKDARTVDGVSIVLEAKRLAERGLVRELSGLTPKALLTQLPELAKILP
jgi:hypothetical protein